MNRIPLPEPEGSEAWRLWTAAPYGEGIRMMVSSPPTSTDLALAARGEPFGQPCAAGAPAPRGAGSGR
jgi:hypothetical protein